VWTRHPFSTRFVTSAPRHYHHAPFLLHPRYCNKSHKWVTKKAQSSNLYVALVIDTSLKPAFALSFVPMTDTRKLAAAGFPATATSRVKPEPGVVPGSGQNPGIIRFGLRAEIDTSPPFASVKEAVTRFEGTGPWTPFYKFGEPRVNFLFLFWFLILSNECVSLLVFIFCWCMLKMLPVLAYVLFYGVILCLPFTIIIGRSSVLV